MTNRTALASLVLLLTAACGGPSALEPDVAACQCGVLVSQGTQVIACGVAECINGTGLRCVANERLEPSPSTCPPPTCTPTTCAAQQLACGPVPDGCGGTLNCGGCSGSLVCNAGQCVPNACTQAGAVCGTIQGQDCGTCAGTAVCSANQQRCIDKVATLPFSTYILSAALAGDLLYVSGPPTASATTANVVELTLSTKAQRTIASAQARLSPLSTNATHLFFANSSGMKRVALGADTVETLPGIAGSCSSLLADAQSVFCGRGGDARYGVSSFGVSMQPVAGGTVTSPVSYLNYPQLAKVENLLFHLGTTDNYYSFAVLGVTDLNDLSEQSLVSGGALDSKFLLADRQAFYFVADDASGARTLTRAPFDNSPSQDLVKSSQLLAERTVANLTDVWAVLEVGGVGGLYRLPFDGAPEKVVDLGELGGDLGKVSALLKAGEDWLVIAGTDVYRVALH